MKKYEDLDAFVFFKINFKAKKEEKRERVLLTY
jgi:hypothetical protein